MPACGVACAPLGNAPGRGGRGWYGIRLTRSAEGLSSLTYPSVANIDLTDVTFMPSPAIGVLATSQDKARRNGADLTLVAAPGSMAARLLTICAIDHIDALA